MKKTFLLATVLTLCGVGIANAQDYKLAKSSGRLELREVNNVTIEGTTGNEIIFSSLDNDRDDDDRAKGLRAVSSLGLEDNTGVGLSVVDKGTTYEVYQLKKMDGPRVKILVPKGVTIYFSHTSPYGDEVVIKNVAGDIEVSTLHKGVQLENVTGKISVKTVHGEIDAVFSSAPQNAIELSSVHAHVDVSLPVATKATLKLAASRGEVFVDPDFKLEIEKTGNMIRYSDHVNGKINGGGVDIDLSATHNNVYLRKK